MRFVVLTIFPEVIRSYVDTGILKRAIGQGLFSVEAVDIRAYTLDKHGKVDDYPFGGGAGMLMTPEPVCRAHEAVMSSMKGEKVRTVYLTPQGRMLNQEVAKDLAGEEELILLCGHYEGIDERVLSKVVTDEVSIGDYVLTGGELPALVLMDSIARFIPGVLHNAASALDESFSEGLLEYPQYTRPEVWRGIAAPAVLLSGHHAKVAQWRKEQALQRTKEKRPDLYFDYFRNHKL
ncbi:MAG: tRNA (guanosine(37)-N1)-methyltransferase TrmD [Lachnospiraceae bacterium]|nr:tRNA (guanosine(37)-N1)-methyltransferase TrmD [Lachnospiraceae bacterium]